jgi:hypothetical protein
MAIGLAAIGLVLFVFIVSTLAAPEQRPSVAELVEQEPNNSFAQANVMSAGDSIRGVLTRTVDTLDYFRFDTVPGRKYIARLNFIDNPGGLPLLVVIYNSEEDFVDDSNFGTTTGATVSWDALDSTHYVLVQAQGVTTSTLLVAEYSLAIDREQGSPEPTDIPPLSPDPYEPNDSFGDAAYPLPVATSATAPGASFHLPDDQDWYRYYAKAGRYYQALTGNLVGLDTYLALFGRDDGLNPIATDNDGGGGFASLIEWKASYDGWFYLRVTNLVTSEITNGSMNSYDFTVREVAAPPTATPTPVPASPGTIDRCEDNSILDRACTIAPNNAETFNFVSPHTGPDNDYYRIWIKPGLLFNCRTSNLSPGVDPNMIVYDQNRNGVGGNDDLAPGDYNCGFSYYATYSGWLYLLVGYGNRTPSSIADSSYSLSCTTSQPGDATPTAVASGPTPTPIPVTGPTSTPVPVPTSVPSAQLSVRVLATPSPGAPATPVPRFVPVTLLVYYDSNADRQPGAGEGVAGITAEVYDAATNELLAQGSTDDRGNLEFTVAAQGPVRISIPFLGFNQLVASHGGSIYVRVAPAPLGASSS